MLKKTLTTALSLTLGLSALAETKPNILLIFVDDLGYGDLGCYGQELIQTPHIDQLAADGMRFTQHYAGAPVCAPSRCSLMTGKHTGHAYIRGNFGNGKVRVPLADGEVTIAENLKMVGYTTACIGKWGLGEPETEGIPGRQGFDHFFGYLNQKLAHSYYPDYLWRNEEMVELDGETYSHDLMTDEAVQFIKDNKDGPFFLYLAYCIPHTEFQIPEIADYVDPNWEEDHQIQASMISHLDADVGALRALLEVEGIADNTLVIFTSDNGAHGQGGTLEQFKASGDLRGIKRDMYEGGIRVPTIATWPAQIEAGTTIDTPSAAWDWMPTFAELAAAPQPQNIDGISIAPTLLGEGEQAVHDHFYFEFYEKGGKQAVRQGKWKAVRLDVAKDRNGPLELYDLENDPAEAHNIAAQHPEVVQKMVKLMAQSHVPSELYSFGNTLTKEKK